MNHRFIVGLMLVGLSLPASANTCVADSPEATVRWLHENDPVLSPPADNSRHVLSTELAQLLQKEKECVERTQEICAIDADIWTSSQDGHIFGKAKFISVEKTSVSALVEMRYKFTLYEDGRDSENKTTKVRLVRNSAKTCWAVDDILGEGDWSLKQLLRSDQ